ncbi:hypothetical protein NKG94_03975 [Micromonospora sp. M12]
MEAAPEVAVPADAASGPGVPWVVSAASREALGEQVAALSVCRLCGRRMWVSRWRWVGRRCRGGGWWGGPAGSRR